jgi:hypothetical protein
MPKITDYRDRSDYYAALDAYFARLNGDTDSAENDCE